MKKKFFALIAFLPILFSCRELVQDHFPEFEPTPTLNSIIVKDSLIQVHVSLAGKLDTNRLGWVEDALVELYAGNVYMESLMHTGQGIYSSTIRAEALVNYRIQVSIPGFPPFSCSCSIQAPENILSAEHINNAGKDEEGTTYPAIRLRFTNDPGKRAYYEVKIKLLKYDYLQMADVYPLSDPVLLNEGIPLALFSNERIPDTEYTMTIPYTTHIESSHGMELYPLIVEFRTVHEDYYRYIRSVYLYELGRYPEFTSGVTPVSFLFSNVPEGYGIVAGYSSVASDTLFPNTNY